MIVTKQTLQQVADMLRDRRLQKGLSQYRLAKQIGYNTPGISRIENLTMIPRIDQLADICQALGYQIEIREVGR